MRRVLIPAMVAGLLAGCGGGSTPTSLDLPVSVEGETLVPVSDTICHVRGTVVNGASGVNVNVNMRWQAFDATNQFIGATRLKVLGIAPGTSQSFETSGFAGNDFGLIGCSAIVRFERIETFIERN